MDLDLLAHDGLRCECKAPVTVAFLPDESTRGSFPSASCFPEQRSPYRTTGLPDGPKEGGRADYWKTVANAEFM